MGMACVVNVCPEASVHQNTNIILDERGERRRTIIRHHHIVIITQLIINIYTYLSGRQY